MFSQDRGTVKGKVTDKEMNGEALPFANVFIKGTSIGGTTDMNGGYSINAPVGNQTIVFSFVGYETVEKQITVKAGQTLVVNQGLGANQGVALDEVQVKATVSKEKASALLLEQKKANVIKESIGAEELSKKGVSDAAAAVSKISGVSKQEGSSNVYVRGLGDRYLNTTMNGLSLPSNKINKKNIDLNLFPSDVIQNISISKAYASNFYGDFAAGNVDITSKEFRGKSFFDASVGVGVNTNAMDKDFVRNEGPSYFGFYNRYNHNPYAVILSHGVDPVKGGAPINTSVGITGGRSFDFKDESRLSLFFTASFGNDYKFLEGPRVDYAIVENKRFPTVEEYKYGTTSTLMGTALYRINSRNNVKYTSLFINSSSDKIEYFGAKGEGVNTRRSGQKGYFTANYQFNQDRIFVNQLTGTHKFEENNKYIVDWGIGYNRTFANEPDRKRFVLNNYQNLLDNDDSTVASFSQDNDFNNQRYFQNINDEELNSRVNLAYKVSEKTTLNFGYNGKLRLRNFENQRYGYKNISTTSKYSRALRSLTDLQNLNSIFNVENLGYGVYQTHVFKPISVERGIGQTNYPGLTENTYNGELSIHALYASANLNFGENWLVVPGVRFEKLKQSIDYDAINLGDKGVGAKSASKNFILPNLSIKYSLNEDQNIRFAASKTVSIPEFKEIAPFVYEDVTKAIGGNPDLLGGGVSGKSFSDIYNIDLKYEWFMSRSELFSVSAFAKFINDPINLVLAIDAADVRRYFRTGEQAKVYGAELEIRKDLLKDEDDNKILSGGLNVTYMHTEQDLYKSIKGKDTDLTTRFNRSSDALEGASPVIINADINFSPVISENYKPSANLVFNYSSDRIFSLGSGDVGNVVEKGVPTLDFILKNKIGENFQINFSAKNLLDPSYEQIREKTEIGDVILSEYKKGINLSLGLQYKF